MNVNGRLKRIEAAMERKGLGESGTPRICFKEADETPEEAMRKAGIDPEDEDLVVTVFKFSDETTLPMYESIDQKIEKLTRELESEGYTREEIDEMTAGGGQNNSINLKNEADTRKVYRDRKPATFVAPAPPDAEEPEENQEVATEPDSVEPITADDLGRMFNK